MKTQSTDVAARLAAGALAGAAATVVMDAITELLYTQHIKEVEAKIATRGAAATIAYKLLEALELKPSEADAQKGGQVLHWCLGIGAGMLAGAASDYRLAEPTMASAATATAMFCFDEFGLSAIGAAPPSSRYPWQTNARSVIGHITYGIALVTSLALLARLWRLKASE